MIAVNGNDDGVTSIDIREYKLWGTNKCCV